MRRLDLTDQRFGRLTVTGPAGMDGVRSLWHCRCDCGGEITVLAQSLRYGYTKSCGCWRREVARVNGRMNVARRRDGWKALSTAMGRTA